MAAVGCLACLLPLYLLLHFASISAPGPHRPESSSCRVQQVLWGLRAKWRSARWAPGAGAVARRRMVVGVLAAVAGRGREGHLCAFVAITFVCNLLFWRSQQVALCFCFSVSLSVRVCVRVSVRCVRICYRLFLSYGCLAAVRCLFILSP